MAVNNGYVKFIFSNTGEDSDLQTRASNLGNFDRDYKRLMEKLSSATNGNAIKNEVRIDVQNAIKEVGIIVKEEFKELAKETFATIKGQAIGGESNSAFYDFNEASSQIKFAGYKNFNNRQALKRAQYEALENNVILTPMPTTKQPLRQQYEFYVDSSNLAGMSDAELAKFKRSYINKTFSGAMRENRVQADLNKQKEEEREAKQKKADEKKERAESRRHISRIIAILTVVSTAVGRILTAILKMAQESYSNNLQAVSNNMSIGQVRNASLFDIATGMPKGSYMNAVGAVQGKFGDITNLDSKALEKLAIVMGGGITDLIYSGMGGNNPDQLLEKILDKYFMQYKNGRNDIGQYVGQDKAGRQLITALNSVSPEIAKIFSAMINDSSLGARSFSNFAEWKAVAGLGNVGVSDVQQRASAQVGSVANQVSANLKSAWQSILMEMSQTLLSILNTIKRFRIGMSETQKLQEGQIATQKNNTARANLLNQLKATGNMSGTIQGDNGYNYDATLLALFGAEIDLNDWNKFGINPSSYGIRKDNYAEWQKNAKSAMIKAVRDKGTFGNNVFNNMALLQAMGELDTENSKDMSKRVDLLYTPELLAIMAGDIRNRAFELGGVKSKSLNPDADIVESVTGSENYGDIKIKDWRKAKTIWDIQQERYGTSAMMQSLVQQKIAGMEWAKGTKSITATPSVDESTGSTVLNFTMYDERKNKIGEKSMTFNNQILREMQQYQLIVNDNGTISFSNSFSN